MRAELHTWPEGKDALTAEVQEMLGKHAVSAVPQEQAARGFNSQLFLIPKKGGGKDQ